MSEPLVSVIIAARDAEATIGKCLEALARQTYPAREVLVMDDASTDKTAALAAGYEGVRVIKAEGKGPARARNLGIREARGAYVAFTDADCVPQPDWLAQLAASLQGERVAGAGGIQRSPDDESAFGRRVQRLFEKVGFVTGYMGGGRKLRFTHHNPTCNVMYRREVLAAVGGFAEGMWPGEDVELDHRIVKRGYRLVFNPAAAVAHYRPRDRRSFLRMMVRYGRAQGMLLCRFGILRRIQFVPLAVLIAVVVEAWLLARRPAYGLAAAAASLAAGWAYFDFRIGALALAAQGLVFWLGGFFAEALAGRRREGQL